MQYPSRRGALAAALVPFLAVASPATRPSMPILSTWSPVATPAFHAAPVDLPAPDADDAGGLGASASRAPHVQAVAPGDADLSTRGLTLSALHLHQSLRRATAGNGTGSGAPAAATTFTTTYTPAQIRSAYGWPALPSSMTGLSADQRAALGAGQTIFVVDAFHARDAAAELASFSTAFGLPACPAGSLTSAGTLPATAPSAGCTLTVVQANASGARTTALPRTDDAWNTEVAIDLQWAHAAAPLARLVLVETVDAAVDHLAAGAKLANALGAGAVSMSFSAPEGSWTAAKDAAFSVAASTYLAATGDTGPAVGWPAVSAKVLAVGATTLTWQPGAARGETAWSKTSGGISAYVMRPAWQSPSVPGAAGLSRRAVADVSFNGDPGTGQYVARRISGGGIGWLSAGGTSLATPQWAGLVAVANAQRALANQAPVGDVHAALYGAIATAPGSYAAVFADVTSGSTGTCATCRAKTGYDELTGLGTPNAVALWSALGGGGPRAAALGNGPVVRDAVADANAGIGFRYAVAAVQPHPLRWTLVSAPAGVTLDGSGHLAWARPVAGRQDIVVRGTDPVTGLADEGTVTLIVSSGGGPR